jgi:methylmalonyl-CoA/ethylmalonyl-CoA epimerase
MLSQSLLKSLSPGQSRLHHIGFVLASIQEGAESFAHSLGTTWNGDIIYDPLQMVQVTFLHLDHVSGTLIELVEPRGAVSPVSKFLKSRGGLHHACYEIENIEAHLVFCKSVGMTLIHPPTPAVAFGGRRIAWALTKNRLLLEFLEGEESIAY